MFILLLLFMECALSFDEQTYQLCISDEQCRQLYSDREVFQHAWAQADRSADRRLGDLCRVPKPQCGPGELLRWSENEQIMQCHCPPDADCRCQTNSLDTANAFLMAITVLLFCTCMLLVYKVCYVKPSTDSKTLFSDYCPAPMPQLKHRSQ